jgi:hypothetical protein
MCSRFLRIGASNFTRFRPALSRHASAKDDGIVRNILSLFWRATRHVYFSLDLARK